MLLVSYVRKVTATVPSSSVIAATVQQPVSPPVVTTTTQVVDSDNPDWTYDPNEPRYCTCNQVSYGDMVACDNSDVRPINYLFLSSYVISFNITQCAVRKVIRINLFIFFGFFQCPFEWFHYPCVGISAPPKGKWYCPQCTSSMKRRGGRKN